MSDPATLPDLPPELHNHPDYEVVREIGRGGMGVVYLARHRSLDRYEALKILNASTSQSGLAAARFLQEIRSAARVSHTHIVTTYTAFPIGVGFCHAMQFIEGESVADMVRRKGPLPSARAAYYAQQVLWGLQHAHEEGMVHRDIKPSNLMVERRGKRHAIKILDFGLAKAVSEGTGTDLGLTGEGAMLGTPLYMAPEQARDARTADIRADMYSLGCTLFYMLTGHPPFVRVGAAEVIAAHQLTPPPRADQVNSECPPALADLIFRLMSKKPEERFATPGDAAAQMGPFVRPDAMPSMPSGVNLGSTSPQIPLRPGHDTVGNQGQPTKANSGRRSVAEPPPIPGTHRKNPAWLWVIAATAVLVGLGMILGLALGGK